MRIRSPRRYAVALALCCLGTTTGAVADAATTTTAPSPDTDHITAAAKAQVKADMERAKAEMKRAEEELRRAAEAFGELAAAAYGSSPCTQAIQFIAHEDRAVLGVMIDSDNAQPQRGVRIAGVTPGSGADEAGILTGDLITGINGERLIASRPDKPSKRLRELMETLSPGDTIAVDIERADKPLKLKVVASRPNEAFAGQLHSFSWNCDEDVKVLALPMPPVPPSAVAPAVPAMPSAPGAPAAAPLPMGELQLAKLNPDLAAYFDTDHGVLVLVAPRDGKPPLRGGDVILAIDGTAVASPIAAWEALHQASVRNPGAEVGLEIVRKGKTLTVSGPVH